MEYLFFLNVLMLSRLAYLLKDGPIGATMAWCMCLVPLATLFVAYQFSWWLLVLAALLLIATALNVLAEKKQLPLPGVRCLTFFSLALLSSFIFARPLVFAPGFSHALQQLADQSSWTAGIAPAQWMSINAITCGALLLTNEINLLIRYGFYRLNLEPKQARTKEDEDEQTDQTEYNAGRIIGILERYLMYSFILGTQNYNAIGFIVAAKGIARFKQMEQRHFAEYVLTGTLASTMGAVAIAALIGHLLPA
jgi:hypothetical protein